MNETPINSASNRCDKLNIGMSPMEVNGINPTFAGSANPSGKMMTVTGVSNGTGINPQAANSLQVGNWVPALDQIKTAAGDFFKVQYAQVEVRCAITRKTVPAGSPIMLLGGMVISQEAFENWLEEHLAGMIGRHQDLHTDSGYEE